MHRSEPATLTAQPPRPAVRPAAGGTRTEESGQVLVIGLIVSIALVMASISVANIGLMAAERMHLQDTVDASAYSAAVVEARYMNLSAYINRAIVANYNTMAFNTAIWATVDADAHGTAIAADLLYKISEILALFPLTISISQQVDQVADVFDSIHEPLHEINSLLYDLLRQDETNVNQYLEVYNVYALTLYQGLLYSSMQADRYRVIRSVAQEMDPEVVTTSVLGVAAEAVSYDELARAVDWVVRDTNARNGFFNAFNRSFNAMAGTDSDAGDHPYLLAAVTESSLDKFTAGRDREGNPDLLRQFNTGNVLSSLGIPDLLGTILEIPCIAICTASCLGVCAGECVDDCGVDISLTIGASMRDFQENTFTRDHVPFIARQRMREVNFFGIDFQFETENLLIEILASSIRALGVGTRGTTSGDAQNDIANAANAVVAIVGDFDIVRAANCLLTGTGCAITLGIPEGGLNAPNIQASATMLPIGLPPPFVVDDHWPGRNDDIRPIKSHEFWPEPVTGKIDPPRYIADVLANGKDEGVSKYDWIVDLDNVGFPHYHYPDDDAQQRPFGTSRGNTNSVLTGPSIAVVGVKDADDVSSLRGLGVGLEDSLKYSLIAIARSQVYYLRNPNRPDEKPSLFNPHWVPRLAPIDSEDTPTLLREIIPFVSTNGAPIAPTH